MYPNPNGNTDLGQELVVGHTYLIYHFHCDEPGKNATYGALKLLAKDPDGKWARFKFRRIALKDVGHFQEWVGLKVPTKPVTVTLELGGQTEMGRFYPFIMKRGDQGGHYHEMMDFNCGKVNASCLRVDSRPYGKERAFFKLPANTNLNSVTLKDVLGLRGKFNSFVDIRKGDKYAVLLENFYDLTVMVMSVDELVPAKSVKLTFNDLQRAKTPYSDDRD